ncbi:MAG: glycogen/starch synthase, partial [Clostridia bacterium]|nr:glycogen/starch synthase [Clostridia bacterium]
MNILFVTSECAPFSKSGGLADVAFSLPPALQQAGDNIEIIVPYYKMTRDGYGDEIKFVKNCVCQLGERRIEYGLHRGELNGVTVWFVEHEHFFHRPRLYGYGDDSLRFAFFSRAVIDLIGQLDYMPEILHCNDWETALAVIYLKNDAVVRDELKPIKSVYTIHNIAYQGQFGADEMTTTFALPEGWYQGGLGYEFEGRHDINLMKGAMLMADAVSTVSPTYARELHYPQFAFGLQGVVDMVNNKLYGILNGIDCDHYDPARDPLIPYHFTAHNLAGKAKCKREIQRMFGLAEEPEWPLLASVARLVEQKGIELIKEILPKLMDMGVQLIVFGQGDQKYVDYFNWAKQNWPGQLGFSSDYNEPMASKVFAGADMYLMPSRFEPCGLSQMMAMRYGTVPIVHETGGLKDSVRAYKEFDGIGDGFAFSDYQSKDLYLAIREAVKLYFSDAEMFDKLRQRCMNKDFSWDKSAQQYQRMYEDISGGAGAGEPIPFEEAFADLKHAYLENFRIIRARRAKSINKDYRRVVQFHIVGRGEGTFHVRFENGGLEVLPTPAQDAEAFIECSYDNLLDMARGFVTTDKLYLSGQLRFGGNLSKGFEIRRLLTPT